MRLGYEPGRGLIVRLTEPPDRADAAARRLHPQADPDPPPRSRRTRTSWCRCWRGEGGTFVEHDLDDDGRARAGRPSAPAEPGGCRRRRGHARPTERYPEGHHPGRRARRPDQGDGLDHRGRVPAAARRDRPRRTSSTCRSSGSPCRPAPRSPWTRAARTSTGWPGCCAGSSSTPSAAARSTSSSPASTSAPSPTGTPRRRCSCTPAASS